MNKELIEKIRCMLDFMEKFDELLDKARRDGDKEWEDELYADLSQAEYSLRECVAKSLTVTRAESHLREPMNCHSDNKIRNKLA